MEQEKASLVERQALHYDNTTKIQRWEDSKMRKIILDKW